MLDWVRLVNFKSHADTTVDLGRLTVLVGPNASGKTSVLEALDILSWASQAPNLVGHPERWAALLGHVRQGADGFRVGVGAEGSKLELFAPEDVLRTSRGVLQITETTSSGENGDLASGNPKEVTKPYSPGGAAPIDARWRSRLSARYLKPSAAHLAAPTMPQDPSSAALDRNGTGLASVLANMKLSDDEAFQRVVDDLRRIIPRVRGVRIGRENLRNVLHEVVLFDFEDASGVPAQQASEGTVLVLGILTCAHIEPTPRILLLDDIEKGLHPRAQADLARLLTKLVKARDDLQLVISTHSPYLLDEVEPGDVRVFAVGPDGAPRVARLTEHPDASHALQALTTGEFFSAHSEAWVLEGSPRA